MMFNRDAYIDKRSKLACGCPEMFLDTTQRLTFGRASQHDLELASGRAASVRARGESRRQRDGVYTQVRENSLKRGAFSATKFVVSA
jgi:hypothetical protein